MLILAVFLSLTSDALSFEQAKILADRDEESLTKEERSQLISSQGEAAKSAFESCVSRPPERVLPSFSIVMKLNAKGQVSRSWREGSSEFSACVERHFRKSTFFAAPKAPFFTSFVYSTAAPDAAV